VFVCGFGRRVSLTDPNKGCLIHLIYLMDPYFHIVVKG